ncbi:MAG: N-acetylmuramoyl-L-alanine amidase [Cellulosilyticum sp.]|nr:N-acetylmuramoyl-L-alanine amidase [Cellulosilyticum sp.]
MKKMIWIIVVGLVGGYALASTLQTSKANIQEVQIISQEKAHQKENNVDLKKKEVSVDVASQNQNSAIEAVTQEKMTEVQLGEEASKKSALAEKVICIDAGHQKKGNSHQEPIGPGSTQTKARVSSGTKGVASGKYEYELNLEVALKLKEALLEKGVEVYMVRETHDVDMSNKERAQLANEAKADLSLRIHADGSSNSSANGFSILVPGGSYVSDEVISKSYAIAVYMEEYLAEGIPNKSRGIATRKDLSGFNWSEVPAVLLEMGFMSNPEEDLRMNTEAFQEELIKALVASLEAYYEQL